MDRLSGREGQTGSLRPIHAAKGASLVMCEREAASMVSSAQSSSSPTGELVTTAERELAAFYRAISVAYGPEEAMLAAELWIEELEKSDGDRLKGASLRFDGSLSKWRSVTINASRRFASRVVDRHVDLHANRLRQH